VYGDTVQRFGIAEGLPDGLITCTLEDGLGYLWMGTARGIARIARSDFDLVATGARTRLRALTFATADGMRTAECAQRGQSAGIRTRRGELWFATTRGIAIVNPRRLRLRVAMHPVIVEEIFTDQRRRKAADAPVVLSPGEADFRVAYTLPAFIAPSRLRFRYRLEGFDREWIDAGGRRVAYYTNVPPGSYTFQVAAQYADDESTVSMASLPLVLAPHFYQRTAFFIAIGFLAVLAVVASHWVRERRAEARGRALEDVIEERTRDLREEIEERTRVEAALRESEQHQLAILRVMPVVLYGARTPSEYDSTWISENVERVTGFPPERFTTEPRFWSSRIHPRDLGAAQAQLSALRNGLATDMEYRWQCADGTYRWFLDHVVSVQRAEEGEAVNYFGIWFDITDRREAEDKLRMSLREKESLLKEIHHRVKNNLTVITSLLSLQSAATKDRASAEVLREAENRVRSMAAIHQQLYESTNLSAIDFHAYADRLLAHLFRTYSRDGITYTLEVYDAFFEVATAIPCGLIINELVTNALKYAFVGRSTGKVVVGVTIAAGEVRLRVADDGVGFVPPGSFDEVPTLGLQLVNLLAEQMRGTARITSGNGTQWDIVFPQPRAT
jgi:PAS domain S-box-containing protein